MNTDRFETVLARTRTFPYFNMIDWSTCLRAVVRDCFPEVRSYANWELSLFLGLEKFEFDELFKPPYDIARVATRENAIATLTNLIETGVVEWNVK